MKRVSFWALQHKVAARILIVAGYLFLNIAGFISGDLLYSMNVEFSLAFFYITSLVVIIGLLIYPQRPKNNKPNNFYLRRKATDVLFLAATFLLIIYSANSYNQGKSLNPLNRVFAVSVIKPANSFNEAENTFSIQKKNRVSQKHSLRTFIKAVRKKYKQSTKGQKAFYIFLLVVAAIVAIFLISALACNIICSGAEALGYIVLILGIGGIIFGLVKLIQRIKRGPPQKK